MSASPAESPRLTSANAGTAARPGLGAFLSLAGLAFVLRLLLAPWSGHSVDMGAFTAWGLRLASVGPAEFWSNDYWCDYLPGYLYVLWLMGEIARGLPHELHGLLFKLPNLLTDVGVAYLLWRLTRPTRERPKLWLPALYLYNPAILLNSTLWGQADSFHAALLVGGLYLLTLRRFEWSAVVFGYACAVKPHSAVILPLVLLYAIANRAAFRRITLSVVLTGGAFAVTFLPFNGWAFDGLYRFICDRIDATMGEYGSASVNALNWWYLLGKNWIEDDAVLFAGITIRQLGTTICLSGYAGTLVWYWLRRTRHNRSAIWESAAILYLVTFLFVTRAHERHVFPFFALSAAAMIWRPAAIVPYALVSAANCANLVLSWRYILPGNHDPQLCPQTWGIALCVALLAALPLTLLCLTRPAQRWFMRLRHDHRAEPEPLPPDPPFSRKARWMLAAILLFALGTRVVRLNAPDARYFDEVYHAYTAEQWVKGNADAWLWRTRAPDEGCAYEWTHPPLAKLMMAASMMLFGVHPWAWRLPAALLGTAMVLLTYGLARALFKRESIALLAAALAALDALPLFASRIGMNDVYFVTFMLAAILAAVKNRSMLAPLAAGAALACKWTMLYGFPLLALIHVLRARGPQTGRLLRGALLINLYTLFVPLIYVGSYWPMVHAQRTRDVPATQPWGEFVEVQKQMWHYHTSLKATHDFSSPAWQWPTLRKAVWCYTQQRDVWPEQATRPNTARPIAARSTGAPLVAAAVDPSPAPVGSGVSSAASVPPIASTAKAVASPPRASPAPPASDPALHSAPRPTKWAANVYAWGNPVIWICGEGALLFALIHLQLRRSTAVMIVVAGFLAFWAPWLASPRIMFLYHYLPSLPFLYIALAWATVRAGFGRRVIGGLLVLGLSAFVVLYPFVTAVWLPLSCTPIGIGR